MKSKLTNCTIFAEEKLNNRISTYIDIAKEGEEKFCAKESSEKSWCECNGVTWEFALIKHVQEKTHTQSERVRKYENTEID